MGSGVGIECMWGCCVVWKRKPSLQRCRRPDHLLLPPIPPPSHPLSQPHLSTTTRTTHTTRTPPPPTPLHLGAPSALLPPPAPLLPPTSGHFKGMIIGFGFRIIGWYTHLTEELKLPAIAAGGIIAVGGITTLFFTMMFLIWLMTPNKEKNE